MGGFFIISFKELGEILYQAGQRFSYREYDPDHPRRTSKTLTVSGQETRRYPIWVVDQ